MVVLLAESWRLHVVGETEVRMSVFLSPYTATNVLIGLYPMALPNPAHIAEAKHQHLDAFLPS